MIVSNAINPTEAQIMAFLGSDFSGPVCMLNLIRYKDKAVYEDGRETSLTGEQAYQLYAEKMGPHVISQGGAFLYHGTASHMILGEVEDMWQSVAIVEYPSKEAFVEIVGSKEVHGFAVHRAAGLEGQLLIATQQGQF